MSIKIKTLSLCILISFVQAPVAMADLVVPGDQIVTGSMCVGLECVDPEAFAFDTLKLKADDPQIGFEDTSLSPGFPTNDWAMGITDNAGSGPAQFFIKDVSNASTVLLLEAGTTGGVAIGSNSTLVNNAVSFGSVGIERRISNVASGIADTDAVNVAQFTAFKAQIPQATTDEISVLDASLSQANSRIDALNVRVQELIDRINKL